MSVENQDDDEKMYDSSDAVSPPGDPGSDANDDSQEMPEPSQDSASDQSIPPANANAPQTNTVATMPPQAAPNADQSAAPAPTAMQASPSQDQSLSVNPNQTAFPIQPIQAQDLIANGQKTAADVANGHITPETYGDLFAKKSTLGKIGTIFGLLVSGAGSGLTHQPNALMQMMNSEIDRDLQAQTTSAANAQNLVRINLADQLNQSVLKLQAAQTGNVGAQTGLTQAQTVTEQQRPQEISQQIAESKARMQNFVKQGVLTQAQANLVATQTNMAAEGQAKIDAMYLGMNDFVQNGNKLDPNSPEGKQYQQSLALMYPELLKGINTVATKTAAASAFLHASFNAANPDQSTNPQQTNGTDGVDMKKVQDLIYKGRAPDTQGMPGVIPPNDAPTVSAQAGAINQNRSATKVFADQFNQMLPLVNQIKPGMLDSSARAILKAQGILNPTPDQIKQASDTLPSKEDLVSPGLVQKKFTDGISQYQNNEKPYTAVQGYGLVSPFPKYTLKTRLSPPADGTKNVSKSGIPIVARGGKWYPQNNNSTDPSNGMAQGIGQ